MPWDGTELWVAELDALGEAQLVAGGAEESVIDPQWSPGGVLHFCSDRTGWWNLYRDDGTALDLARRARSSASPPGCSGCAATPSSTTDASPASSRASAVESLELLDPARGTLESAGLDWTAYSVGALRRRRRARRLRRGLADAAGALVSFDPATGREETLRRSLDVDLDPASISMPRAIEFPTGDGATAHAFYYPPTNADCGGARRRAPAAAGDLPRRPDRAHARRSSISRRSSSRSAASASSTSTTAAAPATDASTGGC